MKMVTNPELPFLAIYIIPMLVYRNMVVVKDNLEKADEKISISIKSNLFQVKNLYLKTVLNIYMQIGLGKNRVHTQISHCHNPRKHIKHMHKQCCLRMEVVGEQR